MMDPVTVGGGGGGGSGGFSFGFGGRTVRAQVVVPSFPNILSVTGNVLTVAEMVRKSEVGNFVRNGRAPVSGITTGLKSAGNILGGAGIALTVYQYGNGQIGGAEAAVDSIMGVVGFFGPAGAAISLTYFLGKAAYEYSTGTTLFDKPK